jgi:hypothetical protein
MVDEITIPAGMLHERWYRNREVCSHQFWTQECYRNREGHRISTSRQFIHGYGISMVD